MQILPSRTVLQNNTKLWDLFYSNMAATMTNNKSLTYALLSEPQPGSETFTSHNNTSQQYNDAEWFDQGAMTVPLLIFCVIVFIFGVVGNALIIVFFVTKKKMTEMITYHVWIMLLAISDLFTCVTGFAFFVVIRHQNHFSVVLARASNVCMLVTIFTLCGLAYDRYKAIGEPFSNSQNSRNRVLAVFIVIVFMCGWLEYLYTCLDKIFVSPLHSLLLYSIMYVVTDCLFPVAFMTILYIRLSRKLAEITCLLHQQESSPSTTKALSRRNAEALRIIKALTFLYVLNVVPVRLTKISLEYGLYLNVWPEHSRQLDMGIQITMLLLFTNNCVNCVVYAGRMTEFKHFICRLFKPWASFEERQHIKFTSVRYTPSLTQGVTQV